MTQKIAACLWFDGKAEDAARFYVRTFPDSRIDAINRSPSDFPDGKRRRCVDGQVHRPRHAVSRANGGPSLHVRRGDLVSGVHGDNQAETDRYWHALVDDGGSESDCGWCRDRFGLSWQIVPRMLLDALKSSDRGAAKRAMDAMMKMQNIDIATIEAAVKG